MLNGPDRPWLLTARHLLAALLLLAVSAGSLHAQVANIGAVTSNGNFPMSAAGSDPNAAGGGSFTGTNVPFTNFDQPTALEPATTPPEPEASTATRVFQAICWYLPNRLADLSDIPRFHVSLGDGQGASLRATKLLTASWFDDNAYCLGWTKRTTPWFGENVQERYLGFLAAQQGNLARDPTEIGVSAHFLLAGFNVAVSAGEAADALLGFVGIDLSGDDHGPVFSDQTTPPPGKVAAQRAVYGPQTPSPAPAAKPTTTTTSLTTTTPQSPPSASVAPPPSAAPSATASALAEAAGSPPPKAQDAPPSGESSTAAPIPAAATVIAGSGPQPPLAEVQMESESPGNRNSK